MIYFLATGFTRMCREYESKDENDDDPSRRLQPLRGVPRIDHEEDADGAKHQRVSHEGHEPETEDLEKIEIF